MFGSSFYIGVALMILFGIALPLAVAIWWIRTKKEKVTTVLVGAATWLVFALILESIPKALLLNPALPLGKSILGNAALAIVLAALLAGIFEETGRFIAFKTVLNGRRNRETAISHGIGHGGFEALFLLLVAGVQDLACAVLINTGKLQGIIDAAAKEGVDVSAYEALPGQLAAITPGTACLSLAERVCSMFLHVGLSILVFYGVKRSKAWLCVLAIVLHALFDVPAALYQFGVIKSLYLVEGLLAVYAIAFFVIMYLVLYRRDNAPETGEL